jgi:hypothetical protein
VISDRRYVICKNPEEAKKDAAAREAILAKLEQTLWPDLMRDLKQLQAVRMNLDGKSYLIRTDFEGVAYQAFKAAGVQPPKRVLPV